MLTTRWGAAVVIAAVGAGVTLYLRTERLEERPVHAEGLLELVGHVDSPGIDPSFCLVRCVSVRFEPQGREVFADVQPDGSFRFTGLADTDYRLEVLARHDLSLVLGQAEYARPGGEVRVVATDPTLAWGEKGSRERNAD